MTARAAVESAPTRRRRYIVAVGVLRRRDRRDRRARRSCCRRTSSTSAPCPRRCTTAQTQGTSRFRLAGAVVPGIDPRDGATACASRSPTARTPSPSITTATRPTCSRTARPVVVRGPLGSKASTAPFDVRPHPDQARRRLRAAEGRTPSKAPTSREGRARLRGGRARRRRRRSSASSRSLAGLRLHDALLLRSGAGACSSCSLAAVAAVGVMEWALLSHDFSLRYVAENNARGTPLLFTITGLWAALEGSILLWALILGGYLAFVALQVPRTARPTRSSRGRRSSASSSRCSSSR